MKHLFEVCLMAVVLANTPSIAVQATAGIPMQRGIAVDLPVTSHAVAVPDADREGALVLTVTYDGGVYVGVDRTDMAALAEKVKTAFSIQGGKTLYIKADARVPYASVVSILDAVRAAGVQRMTLLTAQRDSEKPGTLVPPKGLEMLMVLTRKE
jgi:biopolymer transport protein TolR